MKQSPRNTVLGPLGRSDVPLKSETTMSEVCSLSVFIGIFIKTYSYWSGKENNCKREISLFTS